MKTNLAWAAGLFDGEGSIMYRNGYLWLALGMTHMLTVKRFAKIVDVPHGWYWVRNSKRNLRWKDALYWRVTKPSDGKLVLVKLLPFLCAKRAQALAAIKRV